MHDGDHYRLSLAAKHSQLLIWLRLSVECIIMTCCPFEIKPVHPSKFSVYSFAYESKAKSCLCSLSLSINCLHFALTKTIL